MKKIFSVIILIILFAFTNAEAKVLEVGKKWDAVTVAPDTSWTILDKSGRSVTTIRPSISSSSNLSVKHTLQFVCPAATVINLQVKFNDITKLHTLNSGVSLGISEANQFIIILHGGMTYEIQHKTGTINCSVVITESFNVDL